MQLEKRFLPMEGACHIIMEVLNFKLGYEACFIQLSKCRTELNIFASVVFSWSYISLENGDDTAGCPGGLLAGEPVVP